MFEKIKSKEKVAEKQETSEKQQESTLEREITAGEWMTICRYRAYKRRSRQGRILAIYQAISNRLDELVKVFYELAKEDRSLGAAQKMLAEINRLRQIRERLLMWLTWSQGERKPELPEEVEEIIG